MSFFARKKLKSRGLDNYSGNCITMSDYVPKECKRWYPDLKQSKAPCKIRANAHVVNMFRLQGLGDLPHGRKARILLLDTRFLITTKQLIAQYADYIDEIVIVEYKSDVFRRIQRAVNALKCDDVSITVRQGKVIDYMCNPKAGVFDFIWLDLMDTQLWEAKRIIPCLGRTRCLAITVANRIRAGIDAILRTRRMTKLLKCVFGYKILDWGYKVGMPMGVIAFGKNEARCLMRVKSATANKKDPNKSDVVFYGCGKTRVVRKRHHSFWKALIGQDVYYN